MNPDYRGYYAISGSGKIQMVTPDVPPAGQEIQNEERVQIAVMVSDIGVERWLAEKYILSKED